MHAFKVHPLKTPPPNNQDAPRRRWRRWVALMSLVLGIGGLVWAVRPNPHLARARAIQKELFGPAGKALSPEERKARFTEYRDQVKHLTNDQKKELVAPMREKQKAEMDRYFSLSSVEKVKYLDDRIDRSERMRKEWQKKISQTKGGQPGGGFTPGASTAGGTLQRPALSADEREKRRRQNLDRTTPEERARADRFRKDMAERRRQRGLPTRG